MAPSEEGNRVFFVNTTAVPENQREAHGMTALQAELEGYGNQIDRRSTPNVAFHGVRLSPDLKAVVLFVTQELIDGVDVPPSDLEAFLKLATETRGAAVIAVPGATAADISSLQREGLEVVESGANKLDTEARHRVLELVQSARLPKAPVPDPVPAVPEKRRQWRD